MHQAGWQVIVATQVNTTAARARIESAGLQVFPLPLERARLVAISDLLYWWRIVQLYRHERPTLVHHVAMKPVLYGSLAALFVPRIPVVNAVAGLGFLFSHSSWPVRVVRAIVVAAFRRLFSRTNTCLILQNSEDYSFFARLPVPPENLRLIRGAGVNIDQFRPTTHSSRNPPVVVLAARMLRDKGVPELVEAARILKRDGVPCRILLAGGVDPQNPKSFTEAELRGYEAEGVVEWLGHQDNMAAVYSNADIAVLPTSYREGVPKTLLEAAACALPIIASDSAGCREIVRKGVNGFLVPMNDGPALATALGRLLNNPELRMTLGLAGREIAVHEFSHLLVIQQTQDIYSRLASFTSTGYRKD